MWRSIRRIIKIRIARNDYSIHACGQRLYFAVDYKEELIDYIENIHNYWAKKEVKLISFELDNDQQYYAYVPKDAEVGSLYEVKLTEVEKIEEV